MTAPLKFVLVPVEPTNEIQIAGLTALDDSDATPPSIGHQIGYKAVRESYAAMLAASPGNDLLERINTFLRQEVPRDFISRDAEDELDKILNELGGGHG